MSGSGEGLQLKYLRLGASLYVPATRNDLEAIGNKEKYPNLRSVIFCLEDSCGEEDVPAALNNICKALAGLAAGRDILRFIRVRNPDTLVSCLGMGNIDKIDGFVLPKVTMQNIDDYLARIPKHFLNMATLETKSVFNVNEMTKLCSHLTRYRKQLLSLRIGGNDLMSILNLRRTPGVSIYDGPLGYTISMLVSVFRPAGFNLTAPVYEHIEDTGILQTEVRQDLLHGLFGKTIIHPSHIDIVERHYQVAREDLRSAEKIISAHTPHVFKYDGSMCEKATHANWAETIMLMAEIYGVKSS